MYYRSAFVVRKIRAANSMTILSHSSQKSSEGTETMATSWDCKN